MMVMPSVLLAFLAFLSNPMDVDAGSRGFVFAPDGKITMKRPIRQQLAGILRRAGAWRSRETQQAAQKKKKKKRRRK